MNLSRRRFLQAGSATLLLPLLESDTRANEESASFIFFCRQANGVTQGDSNGESDRFWPHETGLLTPAVLASQSDRVLSELAPWADALIAPKGLKYGYGNNGCVIPAVETNV